VYNNVLTGERVINQASLVLGRIVFTTASVDTTDPCASFGTGKLVELDAFSGKMLNYAVLDTNSDGVVDSNDTIPVAWCSPAGFRP
jgi:type IV pilus assembly protein PilY1